MMARLVAVMFQLKAINEGKKLHSEIKNYLKFLFFARQTPFSATPNINV